MAMLEVSRSQGRSFFELEGDRVTLGRSSDNQLVVEDDTALSRHHALLERVGAAWFVRDLNSSNGTFVNGEPVLNERALHNGDELLLGRTHLMFHDDGDTPEPSTSKRLPKPKLTAKEHEVLVELCKPLLAGGAFRAPASVRTIAEHMFVGEAAVKAHLARLYDKFGIGSEGRDRRLELANMAIDTGSVTNRDLKTVEPDSDAG
jgi:DNA-binding CsgD family transcriptional regulator